MFRLDPSLHGSLGSRAAADRTSYGQLVLDAVEILHEDGRFPSLLAGTSARAPNSGLFPRLRPKTEAKPSVSVEIQLAQQAVQILDHLVEEHGADSRTHLIVTALDAYLN